MMKTTYWILDIGYWLNLLTVNIQVLLVNPLPGLLRLHILSRARIVSLKSCISPCISIDYHREFIHFRGYKLVTVRELHAWHER